MTPSVTKTYPITFSALFAAFGAGIQVVEQLIPSPFPLPGGRLGLSNVVNMVVLNTFGLKYALAVTTVKSLLAVLISGRVSSLLYSVSGGVVSVILMQISKKYIKGIGGSGCGIIGAWSNNIVQTAVGAIIMSNIHIMSYIWVLGPVSVVTGAFTGILAEYIGRKLTKWKKQ